MVEAPGKVMKMMDLKLAMRALESLMDDALALNELLLQWLSTSPTARVIDQEVGDLRNDVLGNGQPWLASLRYNPELAGEWLTTLRPRAQPGGDRDPTRDG